MRLDNWKGIRLDMVNNPDAPIELYELMADTSEQYNVASANPEVVKEIANIMKREHTYSGEFAFEYEETQIE